MLFVIKQDISPNCLLQLYQSSLVQTDKEEFLPSFRCFFITRINQTSTAAISLQRIFLLDIGFPISYIRSILNWDLHRHRVRVHTLSILLLPARKTGNLFKCCKTLEIFYKLKM